MAGPYYPLDVFLDNPAYGVILSFILNSVYFAVVGYILIRPVLKKVDIKKYIIGMVILTAATVVADFVPFFAFGVVNAASYAPHFAVTLVLLAVASFAVARQWFAAPAIRSAVMGIIMGVLANAYLLWAL